jgi:hypothetical protein
LGLSQSACHYWEHINGFALSQRNILIVMGNRERYRQILATGLRPRLGSGIVVSITIEADKFVAVTVRQCQTAATSLLPAAARTPRKSEVLKDELESGNKESLCHFNNSQAVGSSRKQILVM